MPPTPIKEQQLDELIQIREMVEEIKIDVDKHVHPSFWKHLLKEFTVGMIRGIGLVIGTTIVAGIIIYAFQAVIDWSSVQSDVSIENAVPSEISSFLR
ncbi:MAG: hypothetical protein UU63_C0052G0001 [Candidatus Uhrbacteria bacterium GW2011_GWF2_41_430]|nr:MAG: hypothetical protein UU63_C0052G0001 [Candidatus Uhrbacteria bacterium GW2011_GWF2_41_430]